MKNPFDYENTEHLSNVAGHLMKHKEFNIGEDSDKLMAQVLGSGNYKYLEDPRIQSAIRKAGHDSYHTLEKTGKKLNKMEPIIKKAMGGTVEQMRQALMQNKYPGFSDMSKIGAKEAPDMPIKGYISPAAGQDGQLPVGGIDMSDITPGMQYMPEEAQAMKPQQPGQPGQPPQGAGPLSSGPSSPLQQPPSNILQMTPQGQAMNAMTPPQPVQKATGGTISSLGGMMGEAIGGPVAPFQQAMGNQQIPSLVKDGNSLNSPVDNQNMDNGATNFSIDNTNGFKKGGKVDVRPTVFDDAATRRNPKIEAAARALMEGEMKQKAYEKLVGKEKPVKPYDFVPMPATDEQAMGALKEPQKAKWRSHQEWPQGHRVGLRLDIPSYERHGVWVNSIHDESGGKEKFPTSYGPVSSVRNAEFQGSPDKAVRVATGDQSKAPFARIVGELEHMDEEQALAHMVKYLRHPEYRQVGYDPRRHGDFYDRETREPVTHSEHVVQIGPLVLAKNPKYGKRTLYAKGGSAKPQKSLHYEPSPSLSKADIEAMADRMARQMSGEDNPNNKTLQQIEREKNLSVGIKSSKKNDVPVINYEDLKGSYSVGVPGDTSRGGIKPTKGGGMNSPKAGEYLTEIGGEKLDQPVGLFGGKDYGAYGHPAGWASDLGASRGMFNVVRRLAKENPEVDVYGHYHKMSPEALNHAVHMLDAVLAHHKPHATDAERIAYLNNLMRNERPTTSKHDAPYPSFAGFENPEDIRLQAPFNSGMRKKIIGLLGKEKHFAGGKQKLDDIIYAISHPELRNIETGAGGSSIIKFDPSRSLKESLSPHPTYGHDIPSSLVGRTRYTTPAELLAPRSMYNAKKEIKAMGKKVVPFNQAKMNIIREPIDEQYINQLGEYEMAMKKRLGYKKGGAVGKAKVSDNLDTMRLALTRNKKAK